MNNRFTTGLYFIGILLVLFIGIGNTKNFDKEIYGRFERVTSPEIGELTFRAKLDTGAYSASLHATDIQEFKKKDGSHWVRFTTEVRKNKIKKIELPLIKITRIKQRIEEANNVELEEIDEDDNDENEDDEEQPLVERPVVKIGLCMGQRFEEIEVNLTDRSNFKYPLLIGATTLRQFEALVDAEIRYTHKPKCK